MIQSVWHPTIQAAIDARQIDAALAASVYPSPADWRDVWIYQVLVDRFNNPAAPPKESWDGAHAIFQGGTLEGVRQRLDYLKDLGVGALWLSPVQKNCQYRPDSYHGYGIQDFLSIDPRLATDPDAARENPRLVEDELIALVEDAHALGIYIIFDIVLNHTGDTFEYVFDDGSTSAMAPWRDSGPYTIRWRDENGNGRADWTEAPTNPPRDAAVWPAELRDNRYFRRQGNAFDRPSDLQEKAGDFFSLKEIVAEYQETDTGFVPALSALIRAYQYLIARFDVDGFRIDTLKYLPPDTARTFGNAIREYALSIGKKNFFTYGEVYDEEAKIEAYVGRNTISDGDLVGVDAALDFPLFFRLPDLAKGFRSAEDLAAMYRRRRDIGRSVLSNHGDASRYFVTFLDNHDQYHRIRYVDPADPHRFDDQTTLALTMLFSLQGIPCVYYGTEQGLHASGDSLEAVREALWGKPDAFDKTNLFYDTIRRLSHTRDGQPTLRYGRQYFRATSSDGVNFTISQTGGDPVAFSRILNDREVVVAANPSTTARFSGAVIVDASLNRDGTVYTTVFSNKANREGRTQAVTFKPQGSVSIRYADGTGGNGPLLVLPVTLDPMEAQILAIVGETPGMRDITQ
ncbi:MAG: alpha-amylase family glycosyl hydrolase [Anaerolineae bacterium]